MFKKIDYDKLYDILCEYNEKVNLTAISDYEDFYVKHIRDSMLGLPYVKGRVLDVGSGAGFPALVLKNENPDLDITMLDSVNKKVVYLNEVISIFGLENTRAIHSRIEDIKEFEGFDTVTARAVAKLASLSEYCLPFVKIGGCFVAYKSSGCDEEINEAKVAIKMLGGQIEAVNDIPLNDEITRKIIVIRKVKHTPKGYPRSGNKPRIAPLA